MLLPRPTHCCGCGGPTRDCRFKPNVAVGNGGVWPSEEKDRGQDLFALCPSGLTGPYVTCVEEGQWSELKGGSACPGDENTCPQQAPNSEAVPGQGCRCKAGYFAATATATPLTCSACGPGKYSQPGATVCTDCPSTTEPTLDRSACQCPAGTAPKQSSGEVPTPLACEDCPAGYFAAAGSSKCSPCRGYYEFSTARATTCSTCPEDSYANADHSGCQCNQGCTSGGAGSGSLLTCTCPANGLGTTCRSMRSNWEGLGGSCQCRAGYLQDGVYDGTYLTPNCYASTCQLATQYTLAGATTCQTCPANAQNSAYNVVCSTQPTIGLQAYCSCSYQYPNQGRRLHSAHQGNTSFLAAPEALDMETLVTTSTLQWDKKGPASTTDKAESTIFDTQQQQQQQQQPQTPVHISPTLNINGNPATVLPMEVLRTTWEGRDATDVAACLSGALLTTNNISVLAPPSVLAELGLQQAAAVSMARQLLPQLWPAHGSAAVFTSSMYKGGPRLSAKELKAALVKHYASLLPLPSCVRVPEGMARKMRVAQSNVVGMTTRTAPLRGGELADFNDDVFNAAELAVEVAHVENEKHPELCAGIEGSSFRLRFAGFGGHSSLSAATANHIWVYASVAEDVELCGAAQ
uniref:Tyrosine-protein kinase ephrin type A/B receptor-like domain-containing protein n=1 Tax=Tetradesmus obliquus TaxID=3088 RepID=A0A383WAC1_TETOB|eukprot:jgi/Sobl393_1/8667/SZX74049.1